MDHDRLMARGAERQELMRALSRDLWEEDTPRPLDTGLPLILAILNHLVEQEGITVEMTTAARVTRHFKESMLPAIEGFTEVPEERLKMLADLLISQAESVARPYQSAYSTKESVLFA